MLKLIRQMEVIEGPLKQVESSTGGMVSASAIAEGGAAVAANLSTSFTSLLGRRK